MNQVTHRPPWVAVRHGVILGAGESPAAAAAAAAAASKVSRCEVRLASEREERLLPRIRNRRPPAGDRAVLEDIRDEYKRLALVIDCYCSGGGGGDCGCRHPGACGFHPLPTLVELAPFRFLAEREADAHGCEDELRDAIAAIDAELADLAAADRQMSLLEAVPA